MAHFGTIQVGSFSNGFAGTPAADSYADAPPIAYTEREPDQERLRSGPAGVNFPNFLPFFDAQQTAFETEAHRIAYRRMLSDPNTKAPLYNKVLSVAAQELSFKPYRRSKSNPAARRKPAGKGSDITDAARRHADFSKWAISERLKDGTVGLAWSVLIGGLIDGFSVNEKVRGVQDSGEWKSKWVIRELKPKDVNQDLVLLTDPYKNVTGVQGLRYNAGEVYPPSDFLIYSHLGLYGNPFGMSDLRAVYGRYWMLDTVLKLRAMGAEKRALPVIAGEYPDSSKQAALEKALAACKSTNWLAVPANVKLQTLNIAGAAEDYFRSFCADLREEILYGIMGATLQSMAGRDGQQRGDTKTHKDSSDLLKWHLQTALCHLLNNEEGGLVKHDLIDPNFPAEEIEGYPRAVMGGVDDAELGETLKIDQGLQAMGFKHATEDIEERYGRQEAADDGDALEPTQPPALGPDDGDDKPPQPGKGKPPAKKPAAAAVDKHAETFDPVSVLTQPPRTVKNAADYSKRHSEPSAVITYGGLQFPSRVEAVQHARQQREAELHRARRHMQPTA